MVKIQISTDLTNVLTETHGSSPVYTNFGIIPQTALTSCNAIVQYANADYRTAVSKLFF